MKGSEHILMKIDNQEKVLESRKLQSGEKNNPILFIEDCVRKEGVLLNNRIWANIEKVVDKNWKW